MKPTCTYTILLAILLLGSCGSAGVEPGGAGSGDVNLVARGMIVSWDGSTRTVKGFISNPSSQAAPPCIVYFDADEQPVSQRDRPQRRMDLPGLAAHSTVELEADFAPLATQQNFQLAHVTRITMRVDPKDEIDESNEQDNTLVTSLPAAAGASEIFAPSLRPSGRYEAWSGLNPLRQTFTPAADVSVVGIEFSILACEPSTSEMLTLTVRQGTTVLATSQLALSSFTVDCNSHPPAISGPGFGTGYFDLRASPVPLTAGTEFAFDLANPSNHVLHVGVQSNAVNGILQADTLQHPLLDVTFKLYTQP